MMLRAQAGLLPPASATNMQVPDSTNHMQLTRQYRDQSAQWSNRCQITHGELDAGSRAYEEKRLIGYS